MISILMATYNGEKYITRQIESLLHQTVQDFIIYINDDNSSDATYEIVCQYAKRFSNKIVASQSHNNSGSAKHNFIQMMIAHKDDYVMLCDQDDVWKPNKIELTMQKMLDMEQMCGKETPLLVHTDLTVVSETLQVISLSFRKAMIANYGRTALNQVVIQNTLTGCTAMYNRALAGFIEYEPTYMIMHDWWLLLIASAFGKISCIEDCTIFYRQHHDNLVGAKNVSLLSYKVNRLFNRSDIKRAISETYQQVNNFLNMYMAVLSKEQIGMLQQYCSIPEHNKLGRLYLVAKLGTWKNGISRRLAQLLYT